MDAMSTLSRFFASGMRAFIIRRLDHANVDAYKDVLRSGDCAETEVGGGRCMCMGMGRHRLTFVLRDGAFFRRI
jgi:hypothetical protein